MTTMITMLTQKLEEIENDCTVEVVKNYCFNNGRTFENASGLEKPIIEKLTKGESVIDYLQEHPVIIYYTFLLRAVLKSKESFKILPIMKSIKTEHENIFYFFLKQILIRNSSKIENCATKTLIEAILNNHKGA